MGKSYRQLSFVERALLQAQWVLRWSPAAIAPKRLTCGPAHFPRSRRATARRLESRADCVHTAVYARSGAPLARDHLHGAVRHVARHEEAPAHL